MKLRIVGSILFFSLCAILSFGQSFAAERIPGEFIVKYKDNAVVAIASVRSIPGVKILSHNEHGQLLKVRVDLQDEIGVLDRIYRDPNVEYVVANAKVKSFLYSYSETRANLRDQWALTKVRAREAWQRAGNKGNRNIVVAVIDTGVDSNHESLRPNMLPGYNFKDNNTDSSDKTRPGGNPGHGTHCAGVVGATGLIDGGVIGISPDVSIMPLKFLDESGQGDLYGGIRAIDYAIEKGAHIISASWGATISRQQAMPLIEAVKRADDAGIPFIAAAANDGRNNDTTEVYPTNAGWPNTISVAASGPNDEKPSWSNYGKKNVHLAAPGVNIMSTLPGNKYGNLSGTSMATPLVSGLVALLKAQDPSLTGAEARALLQLTGAKAQVTTACNCRVDAYAAVDTLLSQKMFIVPAAATIKPGETLQFSTKFGVPPFSFSVSNPSVGSIDANGLFTASNVGTTTITVRDSRGQVSTSLDINVAQDSGGGGGGGSPFPMPPGDGSCPLGDQSLCDILCQIQPTLPFCNK